MDHTWRLEKGYTVHGIRRRTSLPNTDNIDHLCNEDRLILHDGDLSDSASLLSIIKQTQPDEIYNLAAQSHVAVSFQLPEYTADVDALGTLRILEAISILGLEKKTRFYQASTSELFGLVQETPQKETTPFYPRSPYAVAKLYAYWITVNYREAYGIYACNGILFNHESKRRGETFLTRKITRGLANIAQGLEQCLYMGNIDAFRDWGHAQDYVYMQWLMLQQKEAKDFVVATGQTMQVREFIRRSASQLGLSIQFEGKAEDEIARVVGISGDKCTSIAVGQIIMRIDLCHYRPAEVEALIGDPTKARTDIGWKHSTDIDDLIEEMISHDLQQAKKQVVLRENGFQISRPR